MTLKLDYSMELIQKLDKNHSLSTEEWRDLISASKPEWRENQWTKLAWETFFDCTTSLARLRSKQVFGNQIYMRGLIEISNYCKNNCYYCGIRRGNENALRYHLTDEDIMSSVEKGYDLGFRTFVMQGGEDGAYTDERLCRLIKEIKTKYPDCAITLSLGERGRESYEMLFTAGADRYLLRHETADKEHYAKLHPEEMSFDHRMKDLQHLKEIGYQVGCGFMVGSPEQSIDSLVKDMEFITEFQPEMVGIGPFIPHHDTPFASESQGTVEQTIYLLSLLRILKPDLLLPATTALGTIDPNGREKGILAGANVVMPNLSPTAVREKYELYDNKICTGDEAAECRQCLEERIKGIGYELVVNRGDAPSFMK